MEKPKIVWLNEDLTEITDALKFVGQSGGAVIADTESAKLNFVIANNVVKNTSTVDAVYDATDCYIRILAADGTMNSPIVNEKWVLMYRQF